MRLDDQRLSRICGKWLKSFRPYVRLVYMLDRLFEDAQCLSLPLSFASPLCFVVAVCLTQTLSQFWVLDESPYLNGTHSKHAGKNKSQQCLSLPYQVVFSSTYCSLGNQVIKPVNTSLLIISGESPVNSLQLIHYFVRATRWLTSEQARMFAFNKGFFSTMLASDNVSL